jgi:DNA-binding transcriptional LysR family regulator
LRYTAEAAFPSQPPRVIAPSGYGCGETTLCSSSQSSNDVGAISASAAGTAEEAFEAVAAGVGVVLVAEGNADLYQRDEVVVRNVADLSPAELVVAWRSDDLRRGVAAFVNACCVDAHDPRAT